MSGDKNEGAIKTIISRVKIGMIFVLFFLTHMFWTSFNSHHL